VVQGLALIAPQSYPNPFASYEAIMPGQPVSALRDFQCVPQYVPEYLKMSVCVIFPQDNHFQVITVTSRNQVITKIDFNVRRLRVADLISRWGNPDNIVKTRRDYVLRWNSGASASVQLGQRFTYRLNVQVTVAQLVA
jgi:hypothetical protein